MKTLKEYIIEGILDIEDNIENLTVESLIEDFIKENYEVDAKIQIEKKRDKYIVSTNGNVDVKNKNITALTNGLFKWGVIGKHFDCSDCTLLQSLEGAPKEVKWGFYCHECTSLQSLEGAPEKVKNFSCYNCTSLESLKGAPKDVGSFYCINCTSLKDLTGAPKEVGGQFNCDGCTSLKDLTGAPEEVGDFNCSNCGKQFTEEDVRAVCDVKYRITV